MSQMSMHGSQQRGDSFEVDREMVVIVTAVGHRMAVSIVMEGRTMESIGMVR